MYYKVLQRVDKVDKFDIVVSTHLNKDRQVRYNKYKELDLLSKNMVACFLVDTGHIMGYELHFINNKGLVYIINNKSKKLITITFPREKQIRRYYNETNTPISKTITDIINNNIKLNSLYNLNNI